MRDQVVQMLLQARDGIYVDGTFGRGGHSRALLAELGPQAQVVGIDRDPQACATGAQLQDEDARFSMCHGRFSEIATLLAGMHIQAVSGVLLDVGVSSPQLDQAARGFSFNADGPLDMRMDTTRGITAAQWLNDASLDEITQVLRVHGEERFARRIAQRIVDSRPLHSTLELAEVAARAVPMAVQRKSRKHPATQTFQAVRIHINNEDQELRDGLQGAFAVLKPGGRLAVISFHSLEDRVVKQRFRELSQPPAMPRRIPIKADALAVAGRLVGRAVRAGPHEVESNPRARSATLRVIEKVSA